MRAAGPLAPIGNRREVDFFLRYAHPVISVEDPREWRTSRVARINYSDHHRDSVLNNVTADQARPPSAGAWAAGRGRMRRQDARAH